MSTSASSSRVVFVPVPAAQEARTRPPTSRLMVTAAGFEQTPEPTWYHYPEDTVIILCVRGRGWAELAGRRHELRAGQAAVFPRDMRRLEHPDPDDPWRVWWVHVVGTDVDDLVNASEFTAAEPIREMPDLDRAVALITDIVTALEHDATRSSLLAASGAAWHLLALLGTATREVGHELRPLDAVRDRLRENFRESVTIAELASSVNLSPSHFAVLFTKRFGVSALAYQTQVRMTRARALLVESDLDIAAVAREVGYPDPSYFGRRFLAVHGISPRRYRADVTLRR